jgi:hypothetical protein
MRQQLLPPELRQLSDTTDVHQDTVHQRRLVLQQHKNSHLPSTKHTGAIHTGHTSHFCLVNTLDGRIHHQPGDFLRVPKEPTLRHHNFVQIVDRHAAGQDFPNRLPQRRHDALVFHCVHVHDSRHVQLHALNAVVGGERPDDEGTRRAEVLANFDDLPVAPRDVGRGVLKVPG